MIKFFERKLIAKVGIRNSKIVIMCCHIMVYEGAREALKSLNVCFVLGQIL